MMNHVHLTNWKLLHKAHEAMLRGNVAEGMNLYQRAFRKDPVSLYGGLGEPPFSHDQPSLPWACYLYAEYFIQGREWMEWINFAAREHPRFNEFPEICQSTLISVDGWRQMTHNARPKPQTLRAIIRDQEWALETLKGLSAVERARHHIVLSQVYRQLRDEDNARKQIEAVDHLLSLDECPYYVVFNREHTGDLYYWLNATNPTYFERAIEHYNEAEALARQVAGGIDFTNQAYNLGWTYAEMGNLDAALYHFRRSLVDTLQTDFMAYERGQVNYGLGYVYYALGQYEAALERFYEGLAFFSSGSRSYVYSAAILNLLSATLQNQGQIDLALMRAHDALDNIERLDNPIQHRHISLRLEELYRLKGDDQRADFYAEKARQIGKEIGLE